MAYAHIHTLRGVIGSSPGAQVGREAVMGAVVENSTQKSAPAQSTYSALIKTASGRSTPESVVDLASRTAGKSRGLMAVVTHREVVMTDTKEVVMIKPIRETLPSQRVVKVIISSPHFFSY